MVFVAMRFVAENSQRPELITKLLVDNFARKKVDTDFDEDYTVVPFPQNKVSKTLQVVILDEQGTLFMTQAKR